MVAAVRDPSHPTAKALSDLPTGEGSRLIVVKYDAAVEQDAHDAVRELQEQHGVQHLDMVVANAGISNAFPLVKDVARAEIMAHLEVNVFGVIWLFQATRGLLQKAARPVFAPVGSSAGALSRQPAIPNAAYGPTKALVNWYGVRLAAEEDWLTTYVLDPAFTQTDMGQTAARFFGMDSAPVAVDDSCDGLYRILTTGTKEQYGGKSVLYTGEVLAW